MQNNFSVFRDLHDLLIQNNSFIFVAHQNPDGDAVGSVLALRRYVESLGKEAVCFCVDGIHPSYSYLPGVEEFVSDASVFSERRFDCVIIIDADIRYTGVENHIRTIQNSSILISIDHHHTNNLSGSFNVIFPRASSTAAILYEFFLYNKIPLDKIYALYFLTGIVYDTDGFVNPATDHHSLHISSRLLLQGARMNIIIKSILKNKTLNILRLWGRALMRLKYNSKNGIATTYITMRDYSELGVAEDSSQGISNFLNSLGEARAVLILKEHGDGFIKGSYRTTNDCIDVSKYAKMYGGGGHKKAAGFVVKGVVVETEHSWKIITENKIDFPGEIDYNILLSNN